MYSNPFKSGFLSVLYKDMGTRPRLTWEVTGDLRELPAYPTPRRWA